MKLKRTTLPIDFEIESDSEQRQVDRACTLLDDGWMYFEKRSMLFSINNTFLGQTEGLTLSQWSFVTDCLRVAEMLKAACQSPTNTGMNDVDHGLLQLNCASVQLEVQKRLVKSFRKATRSAMLEPMLREKLDALCDAHELQINEAFKIYRKLSRICLALLPKDNFFIKVAKEAGVK